MPKLPDLTPAQHAAAVDRANESLALTSGAGCGKTLVLARRFTTLLLTAEAEGFEGSPFERFVALTFTDKAALEMLARVRVVLLEALAESHDEADRRRLAEWITELPAAHISTIHSFCAAVLRRYAVEAGVDPNFAVMADALAAGRMLSQAASDAVLAAAEAGEPDVLDLVAAADLGGVVEGVETLLSRRTAWRAGDYVDAEKILGRWEARAAEIRDAKLAELRADEDLREEFDYLSNFECPGKLADYRDEKLEIVYDILAGGGTVTPEQALALKGKPGNAGGAKLKDVRDRLRTLVGRFADEARWLLPLAEADRRAAAGLATLAKLATAARARYAGSKRAAGGLDFEDLIDLTATLLRENAAVRGALRSRLGQLLVDECQDTDSYQLQMLELLAGGDDGPDPGRLFVVGDLKQSIYRFRGAQAEVFRKLCDRFGADAHLPLTESFRSHPAGVAFVNHLFGEMMGDDYGEIVSRRTETPGAPSVEVLLAAVDEGANAEDATVAQAELLAQRIDEMIGREDRVFDAEAKQWRSVRAGDVAVLFARMTQSLAYERALQQRGVPYYVVAGTGFFQQQEVYDVLNALRVIDNPFDDVALFGVLRSSLFGLDDNALLDIARAAGPPYFEKLATPEVLEAVAEPAAGQLAFAAELLARLHGDKDAMNPADLIETLLERTGYTAALLSEFRGERKLGNVLRLTEAARSAGRTGQVSLADFVRHYDELTLSQQRYEQAPVVGEADDVVRIMTIHKAKGLEFPVVFIPDLNAGSRGPTGRLLLRQDWGVTYRPANPIGEANETDAEAPVSFAMASAAERAELADEDVRKLYVAATRHRDHLVFVGADWRTKDGAFRSTGSYLAQLDAVLGIAEAVDEGREEIAYGDGYAMRVARIAPTPGRHGRRAPGVGQKAAAASADPEQLAEALAAAGAAGKASRVGVPTGGGGPAASIGAIAPTALADFQHCPKLYRWRYELRAPRPASEAGPGGGTGRSVDAATAGTLFHQCMELVDFDADLPAQAGPLVHRVAAEMELAIDQAAFSAELAGMLARLSAHPLAERIRAADCRLAELSFLHDAGPVTLRGQIDLLFRDPGGGWHVVDYKSDRVAPADIEAHARRYELQMMIYLAAARRQYGDGVTDATLYFLRPAEAYTFTPDKKAHAAFANDLAAVAESLARSRATGDFGPRGDGRTGLCTHCPYGPLCRRPGPSTDRPAP